MQWLTGTVVDNVRWNARLTSLTFSAPLAGFQAGQFIRLALNVDGATVARPYSLVNAPDTSPLEVYFNSVPEGPLSPPLFALSKGDKLLVGPTANGFLTIDEVPTCRDLWLLATGTGVGPFLSILQTKTAWQRFEHLVLVYSVRNTDELAYAELIAQIGTEHPGQFIFTPCVTREDYPTALRTRIPASIESGALEAHAGIKMSAASSHVMMCGSAGMIADVSAVLEARGMQRHRRREPGHFTMEKYH